MIQQIKPTKLSCVVRRGVVVLAAVSLHYASAVGAVSSPAATEEERAIVSVMTIAASKLVKSKFCVDAIVRGGDPLFANAVAGRLTDHAVMKIMFAKIMESATEVSENITFDSEVFEVPGMEVRMAADKECGDNVIAFRRPYIASDLALVSRTWYSVCGQNIQEIALRKVGSTWEVVAKGPEVVQRQSTHCYVGLEVRLPRRDMRLLLVERH